MELYKDLARELKYCAEDKIYRVIDPVLIETLHRYVYDHLPTGGFLEAVLGNDLSTAVRRADGRNRQVLLEIVWYIEATVPSEAWGSPGSVDAWLDHKGADR